MAWVTKWPRRNREAYTFHDSEEVIVKAFNDKRATLMKKAMIRESN